MRVALLALALVSCTGDRAPPDEAELCLQIHGERDPRMRVAALYRMGAVDLMDDVALSSGRGCLRLRPPDAALLARMDHETLARLTIRPEGPYTPELATRALRVELAVYLDVDDSQSLDASLGDRALATSALSEGPWAFWLRDRDEIFHLKSTSDARQLTRVLAPGNRPYAMAGGEGHVSPYSPYWGKAEPWVEQLELGVAALEPSACEALLPYPECPGSTFDDFSFANVLAVDPRVPTHYLKGPEWRTWLFGPPAGFDLGFEALPPRLEAECLPIGPYILALERHALLEANTEQCWCTHYRIDRYALGIAGSLPSWVECLSTSATPEAHGRALLRLEADAMAAERRPLPRHLAPCAHRQADCE